MDAWQPSFHHNSTALTTTRNCARAESSRNIAEQNLPSSSPIKVDSSGSSEKTLLANLARVVNLGVVQDLSSRLLATWPDIPTPATPASPLTCDPARDLLCVALGSCAGVQSRSCLHGLHNTIEVMRFLSLCMVASQFRVQKPPTRAGSFQILLPRSTGAIRN